VPARPSTPLRVQPCRRAFRQLTLTATLITALLATTRAHAYRPFDSTDAAVAKVGEVEAEYGPLGYFQADRRHFLVAPSLILNAGFSPHWELVLQGRQFVLLDRGSHEVHAQLTETAALLKDVLREGTLQGRTGLSVGTEFGCLIPNVNRDPGVGATGLLILSQRWDAATLHVNGALSLTRSRTWDFFGGVILEGSHRWVVRPVAELFIDREVTANTALSGLIGSIWRASNALSLDIGARAAAVASKPAYELRGGLTWAFPFARGA
jgi:hypothetical protein